MSEPHKCRDCDELTLNEIGDSMDGRCRDCDLDYLTASGSCRECLRWMMRAEFAGPVAEQHLPDCSLANDLDYAPRNDDEIAEVRRRREGRQAPRDGRSMRRPSRFGDGCAGLEYVGENSAEWEALCVKAAGWTDVDPGVIYSDPADQRAWEPDCYAWELEHDEFAFGLRYLALFARLMAIVTR